MAQHRPSHHRADDHDWIDSLTDEQVSDVFNTPRSPSKALVLAPKLRIIQGQEDIPETPEELATDQHIAAVQRMHLDASKFFRFPVPSLHALAGSLAPDELWVVGGRQGNGKSLFLQNVAGWFLEAQIPILYMGTEQDAPVLKIKQACVIAGVRAKLMLKPTEEEMQTDEYRQGTKLVQDVLVWLNQAPRNRLLNFSNNRYISRGTLNEWAQVAAEEWGCRAIILDHLHHMDHGEGRNAVAELTQTVHTAKDLAARYHMTMLAASQITRTGGDAVKQYTPPSAEDFGGASAIERTADVCLTLWRPLRLELEAKDLQAIRERAKLGLTAEDTIYEPMTMGVRCVKDRLGDAPGTQTMLAVERGGQLHERGRDAYATDYEALRRFGRPA
jgi:archaellum biogenesis ATPase FlaH